MTTDESTENLITSVYDGEVPERTTDFCPHCGASMFRGEAICEKCAKESRYGGD